MFFGGGIVMILFWVGLIALAVWLAQSLFNGARPAASPDGEASAKQILDRRFARGEITREQYDLMKQDLQ